uniref:Winged helix-turn-helix domain-containing protein n=1 Tax=Cereibacter sphaeroides (strain ATCC 17025 / ATH 2.4.3) TaxID=349102 RepID=A4WTC2_CERS5
MSARHRGRVTSEAELRRLWADPSLSITEIGRRLGITYQAVQQRAALRGLGPRPVAHNAWARWAPPSDFAEMWRAGVSLRDMEEAFGVTHNTITKAARQMKLGRRQICRWTALPLAEFRLRQRLAAAAAETRAAMDLREMVDRPYHGKKGLQPDRRVA